MFYIHKFIFIPNFINLSQNMLIYHIVVRSVFN